MSIEFWNSTSTQMAFVPVPAKRVQCHAMPSTPARCSLDSIAKVFTRPAVAALLSAAMLSPTTVFADDAPLVFDHDQSLSGANFSNRSDLRGSIFSKSNCKKATFAGSDLTNAQLDDANFQGANFEGAVVANAMATNAKFQDANLKNVDFTNANLVSAQFDGANIEGADFSDSLLSQATTLKLCKKASGVNIKSGVPTSESLMCPQ